MGSAAAAAAFLAGSMELVRCRDLCRAGVDSRWIRKQVRQGHWLEVFAGVVDTSGQPLTSGRRIAAAAMAAGADANPNDFRCVAADAVAAQVTTIDAMLSERPLPRRVEHLVRLVAEELLAGAISGGEARYWREAKSRGLPLPQLNVRVSTSDGDKYVDGLWRAYGLGYEIDGRKFHALAQAFVDDRRRHNLLQLEGLLLMRFAVSDVFRHPDEVMEVTLATLRLRAAARGLPWPPQ